MKLWAGKPFNRRAFLKASASVTAAAAAMELPSLHFKTALAQNLAPKPALNNWEDLYRER